jgi:4-hydroxybenzoate polyprenyltransferase
LTTLYSSFLKGKPVLDVVLLAALYTLRVYMGGLVSQAYVSPWLFQFSIFLFLSLAFVKRYSELLGLPRDVESRSRARGYRFEDLTVISQAGVGSGLLAGLVLALYINGQEIERLYPRPQMLWVVCPLFVYWIIRVWLIAHRGNMRDDPILFAFRDRVSYIVGLLIAGAALLGLAPHV